MSMESFYGGRQGASFIIVKRFDGINISDKTKYKSIYYAVNSDGKFLYDDTDPDSTKWHFIEKTGNNFSDYTWSAIELNGDPLDAISLNTGADTSIVTDIVYQEGMVQCFSQGGDSVDVVNYGEYVIIDTISKDDPDNGKVYRRGMNFDYDPDTNPLAGAEYIGQIVGPRGETPDLNMESYKVITEDTQHPYRTEEYTVDGENLGLVPGYDYNTSNYNDDILYAWTTWRDPFGTVSNYKIGFRFPYLIPEISGSWRKPYYTQEDYDLGRITDPSLIGTAIHYDEDFDLFIDNGAGSADRDPNHGDTGHPFYRKWKINIPKGIKGDAITEPKIFPTVVIKGATLYTQADDEGHLSGDTIEAIEDFQIDIESYYDTFNKGYVTCKVNNNTYYAYLTDTAELHYGYLLTWYDEHEDGRDHKWIDLGEYKNIDHIHLSRDGILTVYYTCGPKEDVEEQITWPTQVSLTQAGTLKFMFNNNLLDDIYPRDMPIDGEVDRITGSYKFIMPWINKVRLSDKGEFRVYFNNDRNKAATIAAGEIWDDDDHAYVKNIKWVKDIKLGSTAPDGTHIDDGTITFIYCDNTIYVSPLKLQVIDDVWIETESAEGAGEGTGDQKVHFQYNTLDSDGNKITKSVGNPINYIVEAIVSEEGNEWNIPPTHLLVWYSDPAYRNKLKTEYPDRVYFYKGTKDTVAKDGWFDLGNVKGDTDGLRIIGNVDTENDLYYDGAIHLNPKKPEDIGGPQRAGWVMTVQDTTISPLPDAILYAYDYSSTPNRWYQIGAANGGSSDPRVIITVSNANTPPTSPNLKTYGFWLVTESRKYAS